MAIDLTEKGDYEGGRRLYLDPSRFNCRVRKKKDLDVKERREVKSMDGGLP